MATKQIGKLKLHCSKRGIAYKWGDGEIHRFSFERPKSDDRDDMPASDAQGGYGGYSGYDGYGDNPQGDPGFYEEERPDYGKYGALYQNDWVLYALLVLLPPLGIWILWQRERFAQPVRIGISAASLVWFVVLLVWLFSAMFGGGSDTLTAGQPGVLPTPAPTANVAPTPVVGADLVTTAPASTPRTNAGGTGNIEDISGGGTADTVDTGDTGTTDAGTTIVYSAPTSQYYHKDSACSKIEANAAKTDINIARNDRKQTACPECYGTTATGTMYYITDKGTYYHIDSTCDGMKNAQAVTLAAAKKAGKKVCPTCIGQYFATKDGKHYHAKANCSGMSGAKNITKKDALAAGKTACPVCIKKSAAAANSTAKKYYGVKGGKYYHVNKTCGGMKNAKQLSLATAKKYKMTACPTCIGKSTGTSSSTAAKSYYATTSGKYYHLDKTCGGMKNAKQVSLATAKKYGKTACPTCVKKASAAAQPANPSASQSAIYYAAATGTHYHKYKTCPTLADVPSASLKKVTKATAVKNGLTACPTCLANASDTKCYYTTGGKYYHKYSTCSGMKNARRATVSQAVAKGKTPCPTCFAAKAAQKQTVYATSSGKYYHKKSGCSGMTNATKMTLAAAVNKGKTPCPTCILDKNEALCYTVKANKYYHYDKTCGGMTNASKVTVTSAKNAGKAACPICVKGTVKPTIKPEHKVYCFASTGSRYYHKDRFCTGLKNGKKVLLATAKAKGKTACPICVTKQVNPQNMTTNYADKNTTCYASGTSAYYHSSKSCVMGLKKTTVYAAKRKGKTACPSCGGGLHVYVYVTRNGAKYHRKSTCGGTISPYKVSLANAVAANYRRCTKCNAPKASLVK